VDTTKGIGNGHPTFTSSSRGNNLPRDEFALIHLEDPYTHPQGKPSLSFSKGELAPLLCQTQFRRSDPLCRIPHEWSAILAGNGAV
jgi:hypothetical protein